MQGDFDVLEVPGLGPPIAWDATALGQRCAGSENCLRSVAVRSDRGHRPETDVGRSVPKPLSSRSEADFSPIAMKTCPQERRRADF